MNRHTITTALAATLTLALITPASAATVDVAGATATSIGAWVKPTGCSQLPVEYANIPAGATATIHVLDAVTRSDVGSDFIPSTDPRTGRINIQVCGFKVETTPTVLLSLDVTGTGAADSAPFAWSPNPGTTRCVNKRTYAIKEFTGKRCPTGWVKR
jgi:hypothetical protein